jgi:hypothetical protein
MEPKEPPMDEDHANEEKKEETVISTTLEDAIPVVETAQPTHPRIDRKRRRVRRRDIVDEKGEELVVDMEGDVPSFAHLKGEDDDSLLLQEKREKRSKHPDKVYDTHAHTHTHNLML